MYALTNELDAGSGEPGDGALPGFSCGGDATGEKGPDDATCCRSGRALSGWTAGGLPAEAAYDASPFSPVG